MEVATELSYKKAAEMLEITEEQLAKIVKAGKIREADSGLIDGQSVAAWLQEKENIATGAYSAHADATRSYEMNGRFTRNNADAEALEHFKKDLKDFSDARWSAWNTKARKDLEAEYAAIEARRLEKLKELGA